MSRKTLRDYVKVVFRQKAIILFTVISVTVVSWLMLEWSTPVYEAQVKMLIIAEKQVESPFFKDSASNREMTASVTQSEIVTSKPVLTRTIEALRLDRRPADYEKKFASPVKRFLIDWISILQANSKKDSGSSKNVSYRKALNHLKQNVDVEPVRDSSIFTITARDFDPEFAAILANSVSRSYVVFDLKQQWVDLRAKYTGKNVVVTQMNESIARMEKELDGQPLPSEEAIGPASVKIIEQSTPPLEPIGLPKKILLAVSILMSIPLALILAFTCQHMDQSFSSRQDVEETLGLPVIACINKKKIFGRPELAQDASDKNKSPRGVSYRLLAQQILLMTKNNGKRAFLFLSTHPKDESSLILANAALFLSKGLGLRTLVIDTNLRYPRQHGIFSVSGEQGIAQVLEGKMPASQPVVSIGDKLDLLPAGMTESDPSVLLDAAPFRKVLDSLKLRYDVILLDGPDLSIFKDSCLMASAMDAVFLVIGEGMIRKQTVHFFVQSLRGAKCDFSGVILSNRRYLLPKLIYENL